MQGATATPTPMVGSTKLSSLDGSPFEDSHLYRSMYMNAPLDSHWKAVKRVLRNLNGTLSHGLYFTTGQPALVCYSDADWASTIEDRRSISGYCVFLGPNPMAWCPKKQSVVSRSSSSEAEYRSLANCVSE
ncbi:secreted RxLR effector protein 161-like [Gossypium hirsutum]|uniref:Secreted RxLR effector protein 161-like n=1 Tax=Gossypium hirsutum TaxID=3635 RepID=A0ABM2ZZK0_GOSHI|nr:secreted RxLR effector protein 161-like [Gossypium hirsutum]